MPAPVDWSSVGGIVAVEMLVRQLGPREASRQLNLSPKSSEALRRMSSRRKWWADKPAPRNSPSHADVPDHVPKADKSRNPGQIVQKPMSPFVPTASQALENCHLENGRRGRVAASMLSRKALEHLANQEPASIVASSRQAKDLNEVSAKAGGWSDDATGAKITMNIALLGTALPDGLKGNYIFADEADIPIQIETEPASN